MNTNLLDLNNDILNMIGDYVKEDNNKEGRRKEKPIIFKSMDDDIEFLSKTNNFDHTQINK
jgi:hypothetical protein